MKNLITHILLIFAMLGAACTNNQYNITIKISGLSDSRIFLASLRGDAYKIIDTAELKNETCRFSLPMNHETGMYRIIPEMLLSRGGRNAPNESLDIICNHENIQLKTVFSRLQDSLQVIESEENRIYYGYMAQEHILQNKMGLLDPVLNQYQPHDEFYKSTIEKYNVLQQEKNDLIQQIIKAHPGTYAAKMVSMHYTPFINAALPDQERRTYYKQHYFDQLDFSDESLMNSNVYTHSLIQYIKLNFEPGLSRPAQEEELKHAVDTMLTHINKNPVVYDFLLNYLMEGFEQLKLEGLLKYIAVNYTNSVCEPGSNSTLKRRMESYNKMAVGQIAPDITFMDLQNRNTRLSAINKEYVLVIFWDSSCPNCEEQLQRLAAWYPTRTEDIEVLAIAIDTVATDWRNTIATNRYNWINTCDLKGWDGKILGDYCVFATPTMFLLDKNRKILARPLTYFDFISALKAL
jgi:hypothetical protein